MQQERRGPVSQIFFPPGNQGVIASDAQLRYLLALGLIPPAFFDFKFVKEGYCYHDRVEKVITVGALANDPQAEIDFCRRSNLHAPLGNIPSR